MPTIEIHSIYVLNSSKEPSEIKLSKRYRTVLADETIQVYRNKDYPKRLKETRVASFTTLFGKNGAGKTSLLIDLCRNCSDSAKSKPLGMLYSIDGRLMLHRGKTLSRWNLKQGEKVPELVKAPPVIDTIFYSTSPFESSRNAGLKRDGVQDVSPSFGANYRFDGLTLVTNAEHLTGAVAEQWRSREVDVRGWISRETLPSKQIDELLRRNGYESETELCVFGSSLFKRWLKTIPKIEREILTANLKIISDVEGNQNVAGRFVADLLGIASKVRDKNMTESQDSWNVLLEQSTRVIDESGFIPANGTKILDFLRTLAQALGASTPGNRFTLRASPDTLRKALDSTSDAFPEIARFAVDIGFLDFKLRDLSSGQFALLYLYAAIGSAMSRLRSAKSSGPVFLLIDEGEMFLHPAWQREYVEGLLDYVGKFKDPSRPVHVMISTHSLIVAADSPPHTLFDVEEGEEKNGFGHGPRAILGDVYGVQTFAGQYTAKMVDELVDYLKKPKARTTTRIRELVNALADNQLQTYVSSAMRARERG